jgi:tetratricopeptide (TPR) repeat protein
MGNMRYFRDQIDPGSEDFRLALAKFHKVGDLTMEAWTLHMLGSALVRLDRLDEAETALRRALQMFHDASDTTGIPLVLDDLSSLAVAREQYERAARLWGAARALARTTGATLASVVEETIELTARPNVRNALGAEALDVLAREGEAMALDDIVAYALEVPVEELAESPS